jgi:hypothetical protein
MRAQQIMTRRMRQEAGSEADRAHRHTTAGAQGALGSHHVTARKTAAISRRALVAEGSDDQSRGTVAAETAPMTASRSSTACGRSSRDSNTAQRRRPNTTTADHAAHAHRGVRKQREPAVSEQPAGQRLRRRGLRNGHNGGDPLLMPDVRSSPSSCSSRAQKLPTEQHHPASTTSATGSPHRADLRMSRIPALVTPRGGNASSREV